MSAHHSRRLERASHAEPLNEQMNQHEDRTEARMWNLLDNDEIFPSEARTSAQTHASNVLPIFGALEDEGPMGWQERALCAQTDPEAFFPEKGGSTREAKKVCTGCDVRSECLEYALQNDERFGIWGGLSERERRKLKRRVV